MLERKFQLGKALSRTDRREIKQAYQDSQASRSSGARIVMLMTLAVAAVMAVSNALLAVTGI